MLVIMDIEWNKDKEPTQIAAIRVDKDWNIKDEFFSFIHTSHIWMNHKAYKGGKKDDFLKAPSIREVIMDFRGWSNQDDILCWWHGDSERIFAQNYRIHSSLRSLPKTIILKPFASDFFQSTKNPYLIAEERTIEVPLPAHHAPNDVLTIRNIFAESNFPQKQIYRTIEKTSSGKNNKRFDQVQYILEVNRNTAHREGCKKINLNNKYTTFYASREFKNLPSPKIIPCKTCMPKEFRTFRRTRNKNRINNLKCDYIQAQDSKVFHKKECALVLSAKNIVERTSYKSCIKKGLRPCKVCNPTPQDKITKEITEERNNKTNLRCLTIDEANAYEAFLRCLDERKNRPDNTFQSLKDQNDFYMRTSSSIAFLAAKGYQNFHLKTCTKIKDLKDIKGFSEYNMALHAGYTPCKICQPTAKHNIKLAIPSFCKIRPEETFEDLIKLCEKQHFSYNNSEDSFEIETSVGKWSIPKIQRPYQLYHINYITSPGETEYHQQPRIFLSLEDILTYITLHDKKLNKITYAKEIPCLYQTGNKIQGNLA